MHRPAALPSAVLLSLHSRQAWATGLVLAFPLLSLVTGFGIGLAGFLFLFTACLWWRACGKALRAHWPQTRWVLLALLLHLAWLAWLAFGSGRARGANTLDAPARMCIAGAAMLVVQAGRPALRALWLGAAGGALLGAAFVAWQRLALGMERPGGLLNPITFGDLSLCLALLALVGTIDAGAVPPTAAPARKGAPAMRWTAAAGIVAGLAASLLTGSRGGWLALPAAFILLAVLARRLALPRRLVLGVPLLACALALGAYAVPQTGVRARVAVGISDVRLYLAGSPLPTSIGVRLDLWKAGLRLAAEHPWTGIDTPAYKRRMRAWVAAGALSPAVFAPPEPPHLHNDALQALVTRGIPGLFAWSAILLAPFLFFRKQLARTDTYAEAGSQRRAAALAGMLVVLAYAAFGLSEVIFWSMKASLFYALLVFLLMGWCLAGADEAGEANKGADKDAHKGAAKGVDEGRDKGVHEGAAGARADAARGRADQARPGPVPADT